MSRENGLKKLPTKADLRSEMEQQINDFISKGGAVKRIPNGISGRDNSMGPFFANTTVFEPKSPERTFIPDVVAALDQRSKAMRSTTPAKKRPKAPKKVPIYDDFGEIVRWEWQEQN